MMRISEENQTLTERIIVAEEPELTPEPDPVIEPAVEPSNPAMDAWKEKFGEDLSYDNDGAFLDDLAQIMHNTPSEEDLDRQRQFEQVQPHVSGYLAKKEEFDAWQAQQAVEEPPAVAETPRLSETAQILINQGKISIDPATGLYQSDDPHASPYVKSANDVRVHRQQMGDRLLDDAYSVVRDGGLKKWQDDFEKDTNERFEKMLNERLAAQGTQKQLADAERMLSDGMYQVDKAGQVLRDSAGYAHLSDKGAAHSAAMSQAEKLLGVEYSKATDKQRIQILEFAGESAANVTATPPVEEPPEDPSPTKQEKREKFVESAKSNGHKNRLTNSDVSIAEAAALAEVQPSVHYEDLYDSISQQG
jgi:hypothetical protein